MYSYIYIIFITTHIIFYRYISFILYLNRSTINNNFKVFFELLLIYYDHGTIELLRFMSGGRVVGVGGVQTLQMLHMPILTILKFTTLK